MALEIVTKKRYEKNLQKLLTFLVAEWGKNVAEDFLVVLYGKIEIAANQPLIGVGVTGKLNVRSILISKHNRLYYRIEKKKLIVLNIIDTRRNPAKNPFKKKQ
jgi:plasmid stabilization system protein ParE